VPSTWLKSTVKSVLPAPAWDAARSFLARPPMRNLVMRIRGTPAIGSTASIDFLSRNQPISNHYGADRGKPIDRRFIERFIEDHRAGISGVVMEVQDPNYTKRYGANVTRSIVIGIAPGEHVTLISDLQNLREVESDSVDCVLLTQTLQFVYDLRAAMASVFRVLKPGGILILTVPGIQPLGPDAWPHYWSFTPHSARKLVAEAFNGGEVVVESFGNVLTAMAFLHGLALEELDPLLVDEHDQRYPIIVGVKAVKPRST
jgi:SAM-dependent methyltransferase